MRAGACIALVAVLIALSSACTAADTLLRTATIARTTPAAWVGSEQGHHRSLLGASTCSDVRWGPLCGRVQALLQLADGTGHQELQRLVRRLHADGALISGSLPRDTWLLLVDGVRALSGAAYAPHTLVPYEPAYKLAPEWTPLMNAVHSHGGATRQHNQPAAEATAQEHIEVHRRILQHKAARQLQLVPAAAQLTRAATALAAAAPSFVNSSSSSSSSRLAEQLQQAHKVLIGVTFPEVPASEQEHARPPAAAGFHPAAAAAADWQQHLHAVVAASNRSAAHVVLCQPELRANSPWELQVAVCPQDLSEVLYWLSGQAAVHWLAPRPRLRYHNTVASAIIQSSTMKTATQYQTPTVHAFWAAGLDGRGQIVGMGDSGVDMRSCFFSDPAVPFAVPQGSAEWSAPNHRKVVYYWGLADAGMRDLVGHGTHTAGSVAGFNPRAPDSKATGGAKGARLAIADLSRTAGGDVNAPQDLEANYFPKLAAAGACVFSDSWGSTSPVYDFQASRLDAWLHKNQDCVSHFAAGNYGENDNLDSTITSPATAKNVVTVGATKSATPNYVSQTIAPVFTLSVEIKRAGKPSQFVGVRLVKADFGGDGASLANKGLRMVRAVPDVACGSLDAAAAGGYTNTIVLARRGSCYFSQKMAAGTAAGAAAVVVVNDKPGGYFKMDALDNPGAGGSMPLFAVTRRMGEQLWALFDNADSVVATIERYAQGWPAFEDIASFSSFGPTADGRIKPDIVGPGEMVSAASGDMDASLAGAAPGSVCLTGRKSGTSMATPLVAAYSAIVRQYFMDGFYPSGGPSNAPHTPSGPLIKGVLMGGACDMQGNTEQYLPLEDSPSTRQGWGRMCLCNSLRLGASCTTNLQFVDRVPMTSQSSHKYCVRTTGGDDVRVTLVWYDPPAPVSASKTLVNDLDLSVVSGGMGGQAFFGNMELRRDDKNTVERVWLRSVPPGALDITVTANTLSPLTPAQNYTLLVQGAFAGTLNSPYNPDKAAGRTLGGCPADQLAAAPAAAATAAAAAAPAPKVVQERAFAAVPAPSAVPAAAVPASALPAAAPAAGTPAAAQAAAAAASAAAAAQQQQAAAAAAAATQQQQAAAAAAAAAQQQQAAMVAAQQQAAAAAAAQQQAAGTLPAAAAAAPAGTAPPAPAGARRRRRNNGSSGSSQQQTPQTAALVDQLLGAMTAQPAGAPSAAGMYAAGGAVAPAGAAAAAVPPAPRRRLASWVPASHAVAWARVASAAATAPASLKAAARGAASALGLPAMVGACAVLAVAAALAGAAVLRYRLARSISLTSAVQQQQARQQQRQQGRLDAGRRAAAQGVASALQEALLADPSIWQQLSPGKRVALGLSPPAAAAATAHHLRSASMCGPSPVRAYHAASNSSSSSSSSSSGGGSNGGSSNHDHLWRSHSLSAPATPTAVACLVAAPGSLAGTSSAPLPGPKQPAAPAPARSHSRLRDAPPPTAAAVAVGRVRAPDGAHEATAISRSGRPRRRSQSFSFGGCVLPTPGLEPAPDGHWGLFGVPAAEQAAAAPAAAAGHAGELASGASHPQLCSKGVMEPPVWQQHQHQHQH